MVGHLFLDDAMCNLYYGSYSLPTYQAHFSPWVFVVATLLPVVLLICINLFGLARKMQCTPLQFLRHETSKDSTARQVSLSPRLGFISRFRIRVFLRNLPNFITLFCGIMFASLLLLFGLCMLPTMTHYSDNLAEDMTSEYQYTLNEPLELNGTQSQREAAAAQHTLDITDPSELSASEKERLEKLAEQIDDDAHAINSVENDSSAIEQAEKACVASLEIARVMGDDNEEVTIYGINPNSRYWTDLDVSDGKVLVGKGTCKKCGIALDEVFSMTNKYTGWTYDVACGGVVGENTCMNIYMSIERFNSLFGNDDDYFNMYVSDEPLQLDSWILATTLTPADMTAIGEQMESSFEDMIGIVDAVAVIIYLILMYLLTKTVIDHSARDISYMKVFGYRDREVNKVYLTAITTTVVVSLVVCIPIIIVAIGALIKVAMMSYSGNIAAYYPPATLVEILVIGIVTYAVVALLHTRRIKKVPMALALKVQE